MVYLFYLALLSMATAIISVYPIFQEPNLVLGGSFAVIALIGFVVFTATATPGKKRWMAILGKSFLLMVLALGFEISATWLYVEVFSRWRDLGMLSPVIKSFFNLFRIPVGENGGALFLDGVAFYKLNLHPTPGYLGVIYFLMIGLGQAALLCMGKDVKMLLRRLGIITSLFPIYLIVRLLGLVALFTNQDVGSFDVPWYYLTFFWHPIISFISFLPGILLIFVSFWYQRFEIQNELFSRDGFRRHAKASILLAPCVFIGMFAIFWIPSGPPKGGRVLFEEYYSDWSKSTRPIDEEWYNSASTYNYYSLRTYLNAFYHVTVNERPLEQVDLSQFDVVLLKIPTKPYSAEAIRRLVDFVRRGGGLWVIGDHTNVFGSSTYLNPLLRHFGLRLNYNALYQNVHGSFNQAYKGNLIEHPIMHKVPVFLYATPCSIQAIHPRMQIVEPGLTTKAYQLDYGEKNFFPDTKPDLDIFFGANTTLVAGDYGRGRVAVFSDSTVFSNFFIHLPGKSELALAIITWLNHRPLPLAHWILTVSFLSLLVVFTIVYWRIDGNIRRLAWPALFGVIAAFGTIPAVDYANGRSFALPAESVRLVKAGFVEKYSSIYLPFERWEENAENDFNTFYIWGQRVGILNRYYANLAQALRECKALFLILPRRHFTKEDRGKADLFLRRGGKVFLFDDGDAGSTANEFLAGYGLALTCRTDGNGEIVDPRTGDGWKNRFPVGVLSGTVKPLLIWRDGQAKEFPILVTKKVGKGDLYVFGGVHSFSNRGFGYDGIVPTGEAQVINRWILMVYNFIH